MPTARRIGAGFAVVIAIGLSASGTALGAQGEVKPGTAEGASVQQTGWWWKVNENPAENNPVTPVPDASAPHMPEGALPASAAAGDPEKIAAIGFSLKYGPGATVRSFQLSLKESGEPGTNVNADGAGTRVVACPITEAFWIGGAGGKWSSVPEYDCDAGAVEGKRSAKGVWSFDLTSLAAGWLAPGSTQPAAVVLVEQVEAPESFQVTFDGTKKGVGLRLDATGGAPPPPPVVPGSAGSGVSGGLGGSDPVSGGVPTDPGGLSGDVPTGDAPAAAEPAGGGEPQVAAGQTASPATQLVGLFEDLPGGALFLLPIALGLAYLTMLALGPNGEPALATARHGVGRVLDRMRAARIKEEDL